MVLLLLLLLLSVVDVECVTRLSSSVVTHLSISVESYVVAAPSDGDLAVLC